MTPSQDITLGCYYLTSEPRRLKQPSRKSEPRLRLFGSKEEVVFAEPLIYTSFMSMAKGHEPTYAPIDDMDGLRAILEQKMDEYNENVSSMDLVLFNQAMEHITKFSSKSCPTAAVSPRAALCTECFLRKAKQTNRWR